MESTHSLLKRSVLVGHVNHEYIDVISAKPFQAVFDLVEYGGARKATLINVVASIFEFETEVSGIGGYVVVVN